MKKTIILVSVVIIIGAGLLTLFAIDSEQATPTEDPSNKENTTESLTSTERAITTPFVTSTGQPTSQHVPSTVQTSTVQTPDPTIPVVTTEVQTTSQQLTSAVQTTNFPTSDGTTQSTPLPVTFIPDTDRENILLVTECGSSPCAHNNAVNFYVHPITDGEVANAELTKRCYCFPDLNDFSVGTYMSQVTFNVAENAIEYAYGEQLHGFIDLDGTQRNSSDIPQCPAHAAMVYADQIGTLLIGGLDFNLDLSTGSDHAGTTCNKLVRQIYVPAHWNSSITSREEPTFPPMNVARYNHVAEYYQGLIYVTGGDNYQLSVEVAAVEVLDVRNVQGPGDISNRKWTILARLEEPRYMHGMQINAGTIYVFGGFNGTTSSTSVETIGINSGSQSKYEDIMAGRYRCASYVSDGNLTVIGGLSSLPQNYLQRGELVEPVEEFHKVSSTTISPEVIYHEVGFSNF